MATALSLSLSRCLTSHQNSNSEIEAGSFGTLSGSSASSRLMRHALTNLLAACSLQVCKKLVCPCSFDAPHNCCRELLTAMSDLHH